MLQFGLRLGQHPKVVVATTPRPTRLIRELLAREGQDVVVTRGTTFENAPNLAPGFLSTIIRRQEGTGLGGKSCTAKCCLMSRVRCGSLTILTRGGGRERLTAWCGL